MSVGGIPAGGLSGSLLVAHPSLKDPNFRKTILFIARHDSEDGALGYVLNRPLESKLQISQPDFPGEVEMFYGGPVQPEVFTLASLQWHSKPDFVAFHAIEDPMEGVPEGWRNGLRVFAGYSGWSAGQLENEIEQKAWIVLPPTEALIRMNEPERAWKDVMKKAGPLYALMADAPDDPSLN